MPISPPSTKLHPETGETLHLVNHPDPSMADSAWIWSDRKDGFLALTDEEDDAWRDYYANV